MSSTTAERKKARRVLQGNMPGLAWVYCVPTGRLPAGVRRAARVLAHVLPSTQTEAAVGSNVNNIVHDRGSFFGLKEGPASIAVSPLPCQQLARKPSRGASGNVIGEPADPPQASLLCKAKRPVYLYAA